MSHAITPTATRPFDAALGAFRAQVQANPPAPPAIDGDCETAFEEDPVPENDPLWQALQLAVEIADEAARSDIEGQCKVTNSGPHEWFDLGTVPQRDAAWVARAERYLNLRGEGTQGFRMIRCAAFPTLVRFEVTP